MPLTPGWVVTPHPSHPSHASPPSWRESEMRWSLVSLVSLLLNPGTHQRPPAGSPPHWWQGPPPPHWHPEVTGQPAWAEGVRDLGTPCRAVPCCAVLCHAVPGSNSKTLFTCTCSCVRQALRTCTNCGPARTGKGCAEEVLRCQRAGVCAHAGTTRVLPPALALTTESTAESSNPLALALAVRAQAT